MRSASLKALLLSAGAFLPCVALAQDINVAWPQGWKVETLGRDAATDGERQRAVKADAAGDPEIVVELTHARLAADHQVNLEGVVGEMRKAVQKNFSQGGYQSACTRVRGSTLGHLPAAQTTCKITLNGGHVMTQTLVAAAGNGTAWSLSYAGTAAGYAAHEAEVNGIRAGLAFDGAPVQPSPQQKE